MADDLYEPSPSKKARSCDGNSSSPSYSEMSFDKIKTRNQRQRRQTSPRRLRRRTSAPLVYIGDSDTTAPVQDNDTKDKRITRSSSSLEHHEAKAESKAELPLIPLGSDLIVSIAENDSTKGTSELLVHILIDNDLCVPTRPDIVTPSFSIYTENINNLDCKLEDISDSSYFNRHKKKELFEKKSKNRAIEIYRHQLHSQELMQSSCIFDNYSLKTSSNSNKSVEIDDFWYKNFLQSKDKQLYRVGIFNGEELWSIDQERLEALVKSKEIQSDYLPANSPTEVIDQIASRSLRRRA